MPTAVMTCSESADIYDMCDVDAAVLTSVDSGFFALTDQDQLIGFRSFGADGQVPDGMYEVCLESARHGFPWIDEVNARVREVGGVVCGERRGEDSADSSDLGVRRADRSADALPFRD